MMHNVKETRRLTVLSALAFRRRRPALSGVALLERGEREAPRD